MVWLVLYHACQLTHNTTQHITPILEPEITAPTTLSLSLSLCLSFSFCLYVSKRIPKQVKSKHGLAVTPVIGIVDGIIDLKTDNLVNPESGEIEENFTVPLSAESVDPLLCFGPACMSPLELRSLVPTTCVCFARNE